METAERSQSENNRALSRAATEMNIATREQAQAFDQLGSHVVSLKERIDRVEQAGRHDALKEAVKGLHTGLERLADQLTQNANQSATQVSALASNLETLAGHVGESRSNTETTAQILEQRIAALDDRIYSIEKAAHANANAAERAIEALQSAHRDHGAQAEHRDAATSGAISRLEDNISKLEGRGTDPDVDQRLSRIEKSLGDIAARFEDDEPATARAIEDSLKKLLNRVEATENRQRDTVSEFRAVLNETATRLTALETKPVPVAAAPAQAAFAPPPPAPTFAAAPAFDTPPFPDTPTPGAPPPFATHNDPFPAADDPFMPQAFDAPPPPFAEEASFEPATGFLERCVRRVTAAGRRFLPLRCPAALPRPRRAPAEAEQASRGFA